MMVRILLINILFLYFSYANTYYIDKTAGDDSRSSEQAQSKYTPWEHCPGMSGATGNASSYTLHAGDSVIFKGGETWGASDLALSISRNGSSGNRIYFGVDQTWYSGANWIRPKFDGEVIDQNLISVIGDYITIDNLELTNNQVNSYGDFMIIINSAATYVTVKNCKIHDWEQSGSTQNHKWGGINILGNNATIDGCEITGDDDGVESPYDNGLPIRAQGCSGVEIKNCLLANAPNMIVGGGLTNFRLHHNEMYGVYWPVDAPTTHTNYMVCTGCSSSKVYNNYAHGLQESGSMGFYWGVSSGTISNVEFYNNIMISENRNQLLALEACQGGKIYSNTCINNGGPAIRLHKGSGSSDCNKIEIKNNIVKTSSAAVMSLEQSTNLIIDNNCYLSNTYVYTFGAGDGSSYTLQQSRDNTDRDDNSTTDSPLFVDENSAEYDLQSKSLCIDSGANLGSTYNFDYKDTARPQGSGWDMGAYEYQTGASNGGPNEVLNLRIRK